MWERPAHDDDRRAPRAAGGGEARWRPFRGWWRRWRRRGKPLEAAAAYALWAPAYPPHAHTPLMAIEERAVLALLPDVAGRRVLDLGCGTGRYTCLLEARGARVVGLDRSAEMLGRACGGARRLIRGDARALPLASRAVDLVVCALMLGDVAELEVVLAEIARVLAPGGWAVYSDLHPVGRALGWRRGFQDAAGRRWFVRHHVHTLRDHVAACRRAGLEIERIAEPAIDVDHPDRGRPAALVIRARRR